MNLESLLDFYQRDPRTKQLEEYVREPRSKVHLQGLVGSVDAFIAAALFKNTDYNHLFIHTDKEEAAYFHNNLNSLLGNKDIFFFPDSYKHTGRFDETNNNNILLRTEAVNRLIHSATRGELIITYSEAIFEKVVQSKVLKKSIIKMKIGEKLDAPFITQVLAEHGFEHADFVYEPGQFSVRGGIIDIFSFGNDYPYRVELFGDEVESIRTFDPTTQLSNKKIAEVTIVPNIQTHFTLEQKTSLLDILPENTIIWSKDLRFTLESIQNCFDNAVSTWGETDKKEISPESKNPVLQDEPAKVFETPQQLLEKLNDFSNIEFGGIAHFKSQATAIKYNITHQPHFNKNFDLLIKNLHQNQKKNILNFIFAENPKQHKRFIHIFEDLKADVVFHPIPKAIHQGFIDTDLALACYTDHQVFERYHKYNIKKGYSKNESLLLKTLKELQPGDFVTHIDHGIGKYSGLEKIEVNGQVQESVRLIYRDNDLLYVNINSLHKIAKYVSKDGTEPKVSKLGSDAWERVKRKTKKKIKDIAEELIKLYAKRKAQKGFAFSKDSYLQTELEASFIYEDTPDQVKATKDFKRDMEAPYPMDRLICGDVGFGKTEIAIRAAFKAVADSKQVAVLVPTTILALQHYQTFKERLGDFPCNIDYINRFKSAKEKKDTLKRLKEGQIDILIGTHSIIGKDVKFKDLGLLVIDEEQKFGVAAKEKLRKLRVNVDTLTLTATPIPRTLQFSLMGARDLSIIQTPPPNRQPIQTELHVFDDKILKEAIEYEVYRGGQVFLIHNRVKDIVDIAGMAKNLCPDVDFGIAHGQMEGKKLEEAMLKFINREYDVLVCTNIVESGLDIPNANTIIINHAHRFGLSDLHQLRGRVGRSNKKAFCYLFAPPLSVLPSDSRKRLRTIEEFADLGSGFNIAMRDLDIRGAGNLLGGEQSGFIAEIGFEMYHKILDEAIHELKESEFKDLYKEEIHRDKKYVRECQIDSDQAVFLPENYVNNINERLSLYTELDNIETEEKLVEFREKLVDRFGPLPHIVKALIDAIRLRWVAKDLGFERIIFKDKKLRGYFISNQESPFYESVIFSGILNYIQQHPYECKLKQTPKYLILLMDGIANLSEAKDMLNKIKAAVETINV